MFLCKKKIILNHKDRDKRYRSSKSEGRGTKRLPRNGCDRKKKNQFSTRRRSRAYPEKGFRESKLNRNNSPILATNHKTFARKINGRFHTRRSGRAYRRSQRSDRWVLCDGCEASRRQPLPLAVIMVTAMAMVLTVACARNGIFRPTVCPLPDRMLHRKVATEEKKSDQSSTWSDRNSNENAKFWTDLCVPCKCPQHEFAHARAYRHGDMPAPLDSEKWLAASATLTKITGRCTCTGNQTKLGGNMAQKRNRNKEKEAKSEVNAQGKRRRTPQGDISWPSSVPSFAR